MSWWTDIRDDWEQAGSFGMYNPGKSRQADRDQRNMVNAQIKAYQDQTALEKQQLDQTRASAEVEKRRVQEKQIRSLRRNYSSPNTGLLGVGASDTSDMSQNLGG